MTTTDKTREALRLLDEMNAYFTSGNSVTPGSRKSIPTCEWVELRDAVRAVIASEVVVTKNPAGAIVAVTRQDAEGRVIEVIAEAAPSQQSAEVQSNWRIEYGNDTGPGDEGFWEWWDVTNGDLSFRAGSEPDAQWLLSKVSKA